MCMGAAHFLNVVDPIAPAVQRSAWVKEHPRCARILFLPLNGALIGMIKPLVLPIISALGALFFPLLAAVRACQGKKEAAQKHFQAWQISILVSLLCCQFVLSAGFHLPPQATLSLMAAAMATSIAVHTWRTQGALQKV